MKLLASDGPIPSRCDKGRLPFRDKCTYCLDQNVACECVPAMHDVFGHLIQQLYWLVCDRLQELRLDPKPSKPEDYENAKREVRAVLSGPAYQLVCRLEARPIRMLKRDFWDALGKGGVEQEDLRQKLEPHLRFE